MDLRYDLIYRKRFEHIKDKRILIYGTGKVAETLIAGLQGYQIVGILDRYRLEGLFCGVQILDQMDITDGTASELIVAASDRFYQEIVERIIFKCQYHNIRIWGANGKELSRYHGFKGYSISDSRYFKKTAAELKAAIDKHEVISFDLFDTLVMRNVLEPMDIFDMVEEKAGQQGILVADLRKKRRTAELEAIGEDIYGIYRHLQRMLDIDDDERDLLMHEEMECERKNLIRREAVCDLYDYARRKNKKIYIISDMYFTAKQLGVYLKGLGISGYDGIYVSCGYGVGKGNGLFDQFLHDVKGESYLHIGDDHEADIVAARRAGIDAYEIKSAIGLLRISNLRGCLAFVNNKLERRILGKVIAKLFNDPFSLSRSSGIVRLTRSEDFSRFFLAPVVFSYMKLLYSVACDKDIKGVIFVSRDGYIFKRIYDENMINMSEDLPKGYYLYSSRRLLIKATLADPIDIEGLKKYLGDDIEKNDMIDIMFRREGYIDDKIDEEHIILESKKARKAYLAYLKREGIEPEQKYLVCDLLSYGTSLECFSRILETSPKGLFLSWFALDDVADIAAVYSASEWGQSIESTCLIENIITNVEPSAIDIDEDGNIVFNKETRTEEVLQRISQIQEEIIKEVIGLFRGYGDSADDIKGIAKALFDCIVSIDLDGELAFLNELTLIDDMGQKKYRFRE